MNPLDELDLLLRPAGDCRSLSTEPSLVEREYLLAGGLSPTSPSFR